ncbi:hypothetical protein BaRGS_00027523 [Batillaria attramentaria]|uniref:Uncharacterized protein n=1 Tax=Batillaria attramentaria TaxID=370345 RepID=A0ABD0K285_9CAEN
MKKFERVWAAIVSSYGCMEHSSLHGSIARRLITAPLRSAFQACLFLLRVPISRAYLLRPCADLDDSTEASKERSASEGVARGRLGSAPAAGIRGNSPALFPPPLAMNTPFSFPLPSACAGMPVDRV